jgi:hypothetical protein
VQEYGGDKQLSGMTKTTFRTVTFSLLFLGLGLMVASMWARAESVKTILLSATGVLYLAAALLIVVYRRRPIK